jgi:uncharacterized protein YkwD
MVCISLAALAAVLVCAPVAAASHRGHRDALRAMDACPGSGATSTDVGQIKKAMLCLHNLERRRHGLSRMRWNRSLSRVARAHARDMTSRHYFAHISPGGGDHMDRIAATAYPPSFGCWTTGENLVESKGSATPLQLLLAWMHSPEHRQNILHHGWRDFAIGIVLSSPEGDPNGMTLVALFGMRSKQRCG